GARPAGPGPGAERAPAGAVELDGGGARLGVGEPVLAFEADDEEAPLLRVRQHRLGDAVDEVGPRQRQRDGALLPLADDAGALRRQQRQVLLERRRLGHAGLVVLLAAVQERVELVVEAYARRAQVALQEAPDRLAAGGDARKGPAAIEPRLRRRAHRHRRARDDAERALGADQPLREVGRAAG